MIKPETVLLDGDERILGVNLRLPPAELPKGMSARGENVRFRDGIPADRKGVMKPAWLNRTEIGDPLRVRPYGVIYGVGVFRDVNSTRWVITAADGLVYRTHENNAGISMPLPTGVKLLDTCRFTQAFDKLYMFRGRDLAPLRLTTLDAGFQDLVPLWSATPAYTTGQEVAYGPFQTVVLTSAGLIAQGVTPVPHGYVTGADVTIKGAVQAPYNGRFNITVVDDNTFTYVFPGSAISPATGTPKVSNMSRYWKWNQVGASAPGDSPDSIPLSWDAVYNILPNADDAIYVNNRLLVPTAYAPGGATYGVSSFYAKKDYVVATDFLDELHFDFVNEFRINQGAEDEIVQLHKMGENTVVVAKSGSWGVLSNIGYDLVTPGATLDMRELEYGQTALGAGCVAGRNVYMLVEGRGVVSLGQTEQSKIQSVDLPLSDEIEPLIKRIAWRLKDKTRMAYWDNKLYVAVPLDDGTKVGLDLVSGVYSGSVPSLKIGGGTAVAPVSLLVTGLRIGQTYQYKAGNSTKLSTGTEVIDDLDYPGGDIVTEGPFVATQTEYTLWAPPGLLATVSTAEVRTGYVDVNNAILVYDFLSQKWSGVDTGGPLMVKEFFKTSFRGVERLFFAAENGWINVIEESESGDQVQDDESETGLGWDEITSTWATRAYPLSNNRAIRPVEGLMHLATWNPSWSVNVIYNRANDLRAIDADGVEVFTRDRTKYDRPFDAEDWNVTNVNEDHGTPGRQDYSVPIGGAGLYVNEGVQLDLKQEQPWTFSIAPKKGTTVQLEVTKTQGRMQVTAVELTAVKADRRKGIVT